MLFEQVGNILSIVLNLVGLMDGVTALHRIKDDERSVNAQTVFICLTADAITGAKERYLAEYLAESEKKYAALEWGYKERSWKDYSVYVHAN